ncbi:MAG: hypothetical protein Q9227_006880 [Pyrenula ochraceoflavens]
MSEPIPSSIPTSADPRSRRPTKKRALTPSSAASSEITALMSNPDHEIKLPNPTTAKTLAPPPEIVANVQGSSAGAGSGEFHVYKAGRRREYERMRAMDEQVRKEKESEEWEDAEKRRREADEEKVRKNREKREKKKARKKGGGGVVKAGAALKNGTTVNGGEGKDGESKDEEDQEPANVATSEEPQGFRIMDDND